ncbi:MAG: mechanosensitive ion channel [Spirochaetales bacterium]|uniref:Mechanosensitive ion channel n=1 Tax=Candidatus Thalassospirochaeta sargassi TaxID=3119039 RepID=A0AAJ1MP28_9SPIO|nr:mechanosensitive ion channel [Spirochaetales bacterium]
MDFREILHNILFSKIVLGTLNLPFNLIGLLLRFVLPLLVIFFAFKLIKRGIALLINKSKAKDENKTIAKTWVRRGLNIIYYIIAAILVSSFLGAETMRYLGMIFDVLNQPFIESGGTRITIITIILTIPVFYLGSWVGKTVKKMINHDLLERMGLDDSKKFSVTSLIQYGVMIVVVLIGMSVIGVDLSALTLLFGVLGIGIGFGLQSIVANIIAGLVIIFSRPVKEGDRIIINGIEGTVSQIRLNSTNITTLKNESIIVPNSNFVENIVHNYSYEDRKIVIRNNISISYDNDPEEAIEVLESIAINTDYVLNDPAPKARFKNFGDSGLDISLFSWISDLQYKYEVHDLINRQIWKRFRDENISIPYPHVHVIMPDKHKEDETIED